MTRPDTTPDTMPDPAPAPRPPATRPDDPEALRFDAPVLLLGGGPAAPELLAELAPRVGAVVAADGGANRLRAGPMRPHAVIGDMDSLEDRPFWDAEADVAVLHVPEQDTTDLEKCLRLVAAPLYLGAGFLGGRFDHSLAALHALLSHAHRRVVLIGEEDVAFLAPLAWRARLAPGARVSLFPLIPVTATASSGLVWPLSPLALAAGTAIGTSNRAAAAEISVSFDRLGAVVMLERRFLDSVLASLAAPT